MGAQTSEHLTQHQPVETPPVEVSDDRVRPDSANELQRRHAILRGHHLEPTLLQGGLQNLASFPTSLGDDDT